MAPQSVEMPTTETHQLARRPSFSSDRRRFAACWRSIDDREGLAGRRRRVSTRASATSCSKFRSASSRFRSCERYLEETTLRWPFFRRWLSRLSTRVISCSLKVVLAVGDQRTSTRVSVVLTCWPPGPEERLNRQLNSDSGSWIFWLGIVFGEQGIQLSPRL